MRAVSPNSKRGNFLELHSRRVQKSERLDLSEQHVQSATGHLSCKHLIALAAASPAAAFRQPRYTVAPLLASSVAVAL